jgi:hypothetical protein
MWRVREQESASYEIGRRVYSARAKIASFHRMRSSSMSQWDHLVIIYETLSKLGKVRYPDDYKDQDVNQVLAALGPNGWEMVRGYRVTDALSVMILKRQRA